MYLDNKKSSAELLTNSILGIDMPKVIYKPDLLDFWKYSPYNSEIKYADMKRLGRWKALRQVKGEDAKWKGFTCIKCPNPWPNTQYKDDKGNWYWENTKRCKKCKDKENLSKRLHDWFDLIVKYAEENDKDIYFASVTRSHNFISDDPNEIRNAAVEACIEIVADFKHMIHKDRKNTWQYFNSGLVVGELKWRRPGEPVFDTSDKWRFNGLGWQCNGIPLRITEEYEAHPHCHFVGLTPKTKMPYKKLMEIAKQKDMMVYFERVQPYRAKKYLGRYLKKDQPSYTDGSRPRIRGKTGKLYGLK